MIRQTTHPYRRAMLTCTVPLISISFASNSPFASRKHLSIYIHPRKKMYLYLYANNAHIGGETLVRSCLVFFSVLEIKAISFATGLAVVPWSDRIRMASRAADYKRQRRRESRSLSQILKRGGAERVPSWPIGYTEWSRRRERILFEDNVTLGQDYFAI